VIIEIKLEKIRNGWLLKWESSGVVFSVYRAAEETIFCPDMETFLSEIQELAKALEKL
jgi:hypothetical protein